MIGRLVEILGIPEVATVRSVLIPRIAQLVVDVTVNGPANDSPDGGGALRSMIEQTLSLGAPDELTKNLVREILGTVVQMLLDHRPRQAIVASVQVLLAALIDPPCFERATDLFLLGSKLVSAELLAPHDVARACIAASRLMRLEKGDITGAQAWLRRAARFSGDKLPNYLDELEEVDRQIKKTSTPVQLPADASNQASPDDAVGEDETGHLQVDRIRQWARRVLQLCRWVESVRRVRKDGDLPAHVNQLLDLRNLPQHLNAAKGIDRERIIPVVLDGSHSIPAGIALRVNIVLPKGTSEAQRAAAIEALRAEKSLFPDAGL